MYNRLRHDKREDIAQEVRIIASYIKQVSELLLSLNCLCGSLFKELAMADLLLLLALDGGLKCFNSAFMCSNVGDALLNFEILLI